MTRVQPFAGSVRTHRGSPIGVRFVRGALVSVAAVLTFCIAPPSASAAAPPAFEWLRQFGGGAPASDFARTVDSDGNLYVAGYTFGTLPGQVSAGSADAFVRKYDSTGTELWTRQFGTATTDVAFGVSADASGVYVAGFSLGALPGQASAGAEDAFVRKYDSAGTELWTRQFGIGAFDQALGVSVDASGVYVAGVATGALPGQVGAGGGDAFVRKYDSAGTELWTRQYGTSAFDTVRGVSADASGVYVAGSTGGTLPGQVSFGNHDVVVRKFDSAGTELWTRQFGTGGDDSATGVSADGSGVYVAGWVIGTLPGQVGVGGQDAFVRKYGSSGTELWTRQFGTGSDEPAHSVSADASGVYVAGQTFGTLPGQVSAGSSDAFVRSYDGSGTELWTRQFGTATADVAYGVSADASGLYVAGSTGGTLPGQVSAGADDAFVRRYDSAGTELWTRQFGGGAPATDVARAVDADGNLYVAGSTFGAMPGLVSAGGEDVFVRKYDSAGTELWTRQFGTVATDQAPGVSADASGVYVVGMTQGTLPGQGSAGGQDVFVRKYDSAGTELWTRQFGTVTADVAAGVSADASGVYVAGFTDGTLPGQGSAGGSDAFVRMYDSAGTELWTRQFGTGATDQAMGVSANASGVYVAGSTGGTLPGQVSASSSDAFVRAYDSSGTELWTRQFGAFSTNTAFGVSADASGVYVVGMTLGTLPGQVNAGLFDAFVRKYDSSGTELWTRQFGTVTNDLAFGVSADASGVYVVGLTQDTLPGQVSAGGQDAFVAKLTSNQPPTADAGGLYTVPEGGSVGLTGDGDDPDAGDVLSYAWDLDNNGSYEVAGQSVPFSAVGRDGPDGQTVVLRVCDASNDCATDEATVEIANVAPALTDVAVSAASVVEADSITLSASIEDPGTPDAFTLVIDWGDGGPTTVVDLPAGTTSFSRDHAYTDDNPTATPSDTNTIVVTVTDDDDDSGTAEVDVVVANAAPDITGVSGPVEPIALGGAASVDVSFTDLGVLDTHACMFDWDDGTTTTVAADGGICMASRTYAAAGVYTVRVIVTDDDADSASAMHRFVVIFDPNGGFVSGNGWFDSPLGAYPADGSLTGKAFFGFVSKYRKGETTPTGNTEFQFKAGSFNFQSATYSVLVVSGHKAQYRGTGTVNGAGSYAFVVTAYDGQRPGGGGVDRFRIKIVNNATNLVVYDSRLGASDDMDAADPMAIGGGSIVIHKP